MLLKEALEIHKKSKWKIDILETLWTEIKNNYCEQKFYKNIVDKLPTWEYFISDLDWTFFRWTLIKEAFTVFAKFLREQDLTKINLEKYKQFLDDFKLFKKMEKEAYNKKIDYNDYLTAWLFLINKYHDLANWDNFLLYLKEYFYRKEKVNPFRFSMKKLKEVIKNWQYFLFVSWASSFVFTIYLELLKDYIKKELGENYVKNIYWFCSYADPKAKIVYNLWNMQWKNNFIKQLKNKNIFTKIIWWMWDTNADYWIANHLDKNADFYFMNASYSAITQYDKLANKNINFHFIFERKDLIYEYEIEKIKILN